MHERDAVTIPAELRALKGWLVWRLEPGTPKPRKVPYYVRGGRRQGVQGSAEDRARWATYEDAAAFVADDLTGEWQLGLAMSPDWGIVGLDFDDCVNSDGRIDEEVAVVIEGTYAEFSPSGTGVHAFLSGSMPSQKSHSRDWGWGFETFCGTGFLTMTGDATPACELAGIDWLAHVNGAVTELATVRFGARALVPRDIVVPDVPPLGLSDAEIRRVMVRVTPDGSYGDWIRRGQALHHETSGEARGCAIWDEHSATGKDYAGREVIESKWAGFGRRSGITFGYILSIAAPDPDAFDVVVEEAAAVALAPPPFIRNRGGKILATVDNAVAAVGRPDLCGMRIGHDDFRDEITIAPPGRDEWRPMTDADVVRLRISLERMRFKTAPKELVRDAVVLVAAQNRYDSAQLWLGGLEWDGVPRVATFLETYLGVKPGAYATAVSRYIWTALAGRVLQPGVKADMVPIFEGAQGLRKSSAIEAMAPSPETFVEIDLADKEDDTVRKLRGALVAEIAELSGLHTRDLEGIKKFVVRKVEKWVPKYKEFLSTFKRRLLFIGTTNRVEILADDTGNRRWLPLHIEWADAEGIGHACAQLWAEGAVLFEAGGVAWRDAEGLADAEHAAYAMSDAWDQRVAEWLASSDDMGEGVGPRADQAFTTADVLSGAIGLVGRDMNRNASNRVGAILRAFGFVQKTACKNGRDVRAWQRSDALATLSSVGKNL